MIDVYRACALDAQRLGERIRSEFGLPAKYVAARESLKDKK